MSKRRERWWHKAYQGIICPDRPSDDYAPAPTTTLNAEQKRGLLDGSFEWARRKTDGLLIVVPKMTDAEREKVEGAYLSYPGEMAPRS